MSFTLHQVTRRAGGGDIVRTKKIETAEPVIGRGADCDIQLLDLAVNLRHATLKQTGRGRVEAHAIGPTSFEANGSFTSHAQLLLADKPKLVFGSHELVLAPGSGDEVIVTVTHREGTIAEGDIQDERRVFSLATSMFSRRRAAWVLLAGLLVLGLILPIVYFHLYRDAGLTAANAPPPSIPRADVQWEGGSLSPGHRFLEKDCQACHQKAFVSVRDEACLACHKAGLEKEASLRLAATMRAAGSPFAAEPARDHARSDRMAKAEISSDGLGQKISATIARTFNHPEGRCASCHTEHVGPDKPASTNKTAPPQVTAGQVVEHDCAGCHGGLKERLPDTALLNVADWSNHPEFRPLVTMDAKGPRLQRIALTDHPMENNGLIFPHKLHLSTKGGVARMAQELGQARGYGSSLDCANCHRPDASGRGFQPIEMVHDCSACHSLAFARMDGKLKMLPHRHPDQVVKTLTAFYASGEAQWADTGDLFRRRPGYEREPPMPPSNDAVWRSVRAVFTKGGACYGCHTIVPPKDPKSLAYTMAPVHLESRFLPRGGFDHSVPAHRVDANGKPTCDGCHAAEKSERSADLLLPPILKCGACHGQPKLLTAQAASDRCTECHGYHNPGTPAVYMPAVWDALP